MVGGGHYLRLRLLDAHTVSTEVGVVVGGWGLWAGQEAGWLVGLGLTSVAPALSAVSLKLEGRGCLQRRRRMSHTHVPSCPLTFPPACPPARPTRAPPMQLGQHLSRSEQRALVHRRDYLLRYLDALVATRGYAAVVRE